MSHASIPPELRAMAPSEALLRLSIGLEAVSDLAADLVRAIEGASASCVPLPVGPASTCSGREFR
jgi:hypothetical protein